jgi:FkbM family methyltransferase
MKIYTRYLKYYFQNSRNHTKLLDLIPRDKIWKYLGGYEIGNALIRFAKDGYDDLLYREHNLVAGQSVLVLGAYKGSSIQEWIDRYPVKVYAVEPVKEYIDVLLRKYAKNKSLEIFPFAVGNKSEEIEINLDEYSTSTFIDSKNKRRIQKYDIVGYLKSLEIFPTVLEINIEGGEYEVMERLITSGTLSKIETLVIQFHNYNIECEFNRARIRLELSKTHQCVFNYEWIWERWEKMNKT